MKETNAPQFLLQIATAYQQSKALFSFIELEIPTLLSNGPRHSNDIAQSVGIHPLAMNRLLNVCVSLELLERNNEQFGNSEVSQNFLVKNNPNYLGDYFLNMDQTSYPLWQKLTTRLRQWRPGINDSSTPQEEDQGADSMQSYHNMALMTGEALGKSFDFRPYKNLLDLGGGTAAMSIGICKVNPHLKAKVFELTEIAKAADQYIDESPMQNRIRIMEGNFKEDELPENFDVVLMANLLSVSSAKTNQKLLKKIYEKLPSGGACLLSGWILDDTRSTPLMPILFCLEDINWQVPDVERTESTYKNWLEEAGFVRMERKTYFPPTSFIVGYKD